MAKECQTVLLPAGKIKKAFECGKQTFGLAFLLEGA
jgi:hypothetical protein